LSGTTFHSVGTLKTVQEVLEEAQRVGTLGDRPIPEVIDHARRFLAFLPPGKLNIIDIGTGAGVPGLVIAAERTDCHLTLADRRATRMDALMRGVAATGLGDHTQVVTGDVRDLGRSPDHAGKYDVVVSRGFGPPETTLTLARPLLKDGGILLVAEPPTHEPGRWDSAVIARVGFSGPRVENGIARLVAEPLER
jgi:16S rRNA (guanine527-N7)-methyltransferase